MRRLIQRFLEQKIEPQLALGTERLKQLRTLLEANSYELPANSYEILADRVAQLESWHGKTKSLLPVIKTLLKLQSLTL